MQIGKEDTIFNWEYKISQKIPVNTHVAVQRILTTEMSFLILK